MDPKLGQRGGDGMPTEKKVQEVAEIAELLRTASLAVLTDYRGLSVADLQRLRAELPGGADDNL